MSASAAARPVRPNARRGVLAETLPLAGIALVFTLLRLSGETLGWSERWFSRVTAGTVPANAVSWLVGITWLALPFGAWLAYRLVGSGVVPAHAPRAVALALTGCLALYLAPRLLVPRLARGLPSFLLLIWSSSVLAAVVASIGWPALSRRLLAYGLLSRLPVVVVMAFALHGHWGTHYDFQDVPQFREMPFWPAFFWLAFFPQLVFWVGFTITVGMAAGTVTALARRHAGATAAHEPAARAGAA